jgi:quercetin dioxygenase-like cupin family protein
VVTLHEQHEEHNWRVGTKLLYEDDRVRVWLLDLEPGEVMPWHVHHHDYTFVVSESGTVRCEFESGGFELQQDQPVGYAEFRKQDEPHRLINIGDGHYQNVVVELKRSRPGCSRRSFSPAASST